MDYYNNANNDKENSSNENYFENPYRENTADSLERVSFSESASFSGVDTAQEAVQSEVVWKTFSFVALALLLTTFSAFITVTSNMLYVVADKFVFFIIAELVIVFAAGFVMRRNMVISSAVLFALYSLMNGFTLSVIFISYEIGSITNVAATAAVLFIVMAVIGVTTKKDLTSLGGILLMGLVGIIVTSVLNMVFFKSGTMDFTISLIGVGIFMGLTAYDAQKTRIMAASNPMYSTNVLALYGAMNLYLDLINLFLKLLRILGKRR